MSRRVASALCIVLLLACVSFAVAGRRDQPPGDRNPSDDNLLPAPDRIENQVLDLLDDEFTMVGNEEQDLWESAPFRTKDFNRIGLRFSATSDSAPVSCWVAWQYVSDDEFIDGVPFVTRPLFRTIPDPPGNGSGESPRTDVPGDQRPDGIPDLYRPRQTYPRLSYPPSIDFTEVRGLGARVRCSIPVFQVIGDDPTDPAGGAEVSAALTDVKILLRRE